MPSKDTKILEYNLYRKSDKIPFMIYADLECKIEKIDGHKTNPENSFTTKESEHVAWGFLMSTISLLRNKENKHHVCRGKNCMKRLYESLREDEM